MTKIVGNYEELGPTNDTTTVYRFKLKVVRKIQIINRRFSKLLFPERKKGSIYK